MTDHPITPPPELLQKWYDGKSDYWTDMICAAQWGADHELQACCNWLPNLPPWSGENLRKHRRPKQTTLKELALHELGYVYNNEKIDDHTYDTIRKALEALPE
jgi:hypothetical protein